MKYILGVETTAHTFGVAVVDMDGKILSNVRDMYTTESGGMIPLEVRAHHKNVALELYEKALAEAGVEESDIEAIAFSNAPGLAPCLLGGMEFVKAKATELSIPVIPVNHCIAHLEIGSSIGATDPVMLYASGANTQVIAYEAGKYRVFGETLDLGVGNFIDTVARTMGLGFPGGPKIQKLAEEYEGESKKKQYEKDEHGYGNLNGKEFVFLHGYKFGIDDDFWKWLEGEIISYGGRVVFAKTLPNRTDPNIDEQRDFVLENVKFNENTIIVAHSLGNALAMKLIPKLKNKIDKLIMVAPASSIKFRDDKKRPGIENYCDWKFNYSEVKKNVEVISILGDENDHILRKESAAELAKSFSVNYKMVVANNTHFNSREEPAILEKVLESQTNTDKHRPELIDLPYSIKGMDVAFSGLQTKIRNLLDKGEDKAKIAYSMQEVVFAMLVEAAERALAHTGKTELLLGGGVACNSRLQEMCRIMCEERGCKLFVPDRSLLVDNAGMIGYLGLKMFKSGLGTKDLDSVDIAPRERTDDVEVSWK